MSILINGMGMPDSCFHCKLAEVCQYYKAEHYANKRHEDCPLEEVPETHEERTETHACDLISRQATIDALEKVAEMYLWRVPGDCDSYSQYNEAWQDALSRAESEIEALPSAQAEVLACGEGELIAQPEIIQCKDCKHWKDSDGVYRRGIGAESKCPLNIRAVYEGNFYCADAERRTDG